jgi:hypothetical protein
VEISNPPLSTTDYDRGPKAFHRLQTLPWTRIPLPGKPDVREAAAKLPEEVGAATADLDIPEEETELEEAEWLPFRA